MASQGSQWTILAENFVKYVLHDERAKRWLNAFERRLVPDESLLQTIMMHSPYKQSLINHNLRWIYWPHQATTRTSRRRARRIPAHPQHPPACHAKSCNANNDNIRQRRRTVGPSHPASTCQDGDPFEYWEKVGNKTRDYVGGPRCIVKSELPTIFSSPYMFARKLDPSVDPDVLPVRAAQSCSSHVISSDSLICHSPPGVG